MERRLYDVIVPKEYENDQDGRPVKRTAWNRVGHAWTSKSGDSINFELYLIPNQLYVIQLRSKAVEPTNDSVDFPSF